MDEIFIKNLRVEGILGVYEGERVTPQTILVNIRLGADTRQAAQSDDLRDCINYDALSQKVKAHILAAKRFTVEALAEDIAQICLAEAGVQEAHVRVEKPEAIDFVEGVGVEIKRVKAD